jgi:hypothetical protein
MWESVLAACASALQADTDALKTDIDNMRAA